MKYLYKIEIHELDQGGYTAFVYRPGEDAEAPTAYADSLKTLLQRIVRAVKALDTEAEVKVG